MEMTGKIAERYVAAVERENERTRLYNALLAEQMGAQNAGRIAELRTAISAIDGDGDQ